MQDFNEQKNKQKKVSFEKLSFDEKQNLVGFFDLLLEIDKRVNPEIYKEDYEIKTKK